MGRVQHEHPQERAWVEVDTDAVRRNFRRIRSAVGLGAKLVPMVKADGYGLGAERVAKVLLPERPFGFGVATVEEGAALQRAGVRTPVMVYAPLPPDALARAVGLGFVPSISDLGGLDALKAIAESSGVPGPVSFQVEVDTGMGRAGFPLSAAGDGWWPAIQAAATSDVLRLFGVFTHLHSADSPDLASARRQVEHFEEFVRAAEGIGPDALVHFANSAGCLRLPSQLANAARPGIYLYGGRAGGEGVSPEPAVAVRARIALLRDVPPGTTTGYGAEYRARRREHWATVAIGYGDGLPRTLGNRGAAIVGGRPAPIVGRLSMDTTVLRLDGGDPDAGHGAPLGDPDAGRGPSLGDPVTFIGLAGGAALHLDDVAEQAGTIGYEILTGLSPRLPRVAVRDSAVQESQGSIAQWNA